jgi:hypothetical protein
MSVNIPPNPNVSTFNNLYWTQADDALTTGEADLRYLKFPIAQGTENLAAINVNGVATFNSTMIGNLTGNASSATQVFTTSNSDNNPHFLNFVDTNNAGSNKNIRTTTGINCNPSTKSITATTFIGALTGAASQVEVTDNNTSATFYPVFTSATGTGQTLNADATTGPFSVNPNTGDLRLASTLKIVGATSNAQVAIGINAGASSGNFSTAVGNNSGTSSAASCVAIGTDAGRFLQLDTAIAIGASAGQGTSTATTGQAAGAIAIGANAGSLRQKPNSVAIGTDAGRFRQGITGTTTNAGGCVAIGNFAGRGIDDTTGGQGIRSVAIGNVAGQSTQGESCVAVGDDSANSNQGNFSVAVGKNAGNQNQATNNVAIGFDAGRFSQGILTTGSTGGCVAIGQNAGRGTGVGANYQQPNAVAVGLNAGNTNQGINSVAMGSSAGTSNQGTNCVAVGCQAGQTSQGNSATAIGINAGQQSQGTSAVAIGDGAGFGNASFAGTGQGDNAVAIGVGAGQAIAAINTGQKTNAVAIGRFAGQNTQGQSSVAIGNAAASVIQGEYSVAIGISAGNDRQGSNAVHIGRDAGLFCMGSAPGDSCIAIGYGAGIGSASLSGGQGTSAVAIGKSAGAVNQGNSSVAIGALAGTLNQNANSICLNASGSAFNTTASGFFVNPVRTTTAQANTIVTYDTTTRELTSTSTLTGFSYLQEVEDPMLSRVGRAGGLVGYTYDPAFVTNISAVVPTNRTYLMASYFYAGQVITDLGVVANATSIAAGSNLQLGLYTGAGALVASTAVLTNSSTFVANQYTFFPVVVGVTPTPYTIPTSGFYYYAIGAGATAPTTTFLSVNPPSMINYPNTGAITTGAISNLRFGVFTTAGTYMPSSLNTISVTNNSGIYLVAAE